MAIQDDGIFLLEVLIDKIVFVKSPCFSDRDFRTCVTIACPAVEPMEICDDDPGACSAKSGGPFIKNFNSGKSCLFSLKESDITAAMSKFPVHVSVFKSLPCGCLPTKIVMGEATIDMTKEFVEARKNFLKDPTTVSYQALKDAFRITGPDGVETGEIVIFLRISCFGKLIITRFQGGGPPTLGAGGGSNIHDRSCNPKREFQTTQDPCACGAARAGGGGAGGSTEGAIGGRGGSCPPARDPYNSMPCEDPDDPCYCTGPKPAAKQQMVCRNTDQYCLHVPKGEMPIMPLVQDIPEEIKRSILASFTQSNQQKACIGRSQVKNIINEYLKRPVDHMNSSHTQFDNLSSSSFSTIKSKRRSVSFYDNSHQSVSCSYKTDETNHYLNAERNIFDKQEMAIYMTFYNNARSCTRTISTSGTQATASINKCLQVHGNANMYAPSDDTNINQYKYSTCTMSGLQYRDNRRIDRIRYSDVYFFGRKRDASKSDRLGMGSSGPRTKRYRTEETHALPTTTDSKISQTRKPSGASTGTLTKSVMIVDDKDKCNSNKGEMVATVSHIKLGPKEPCPVHGSQPCQGPKCIVASSGEQQAPVKVTSVNNPRRGVFELVIRRLTGAPLAKNELMLEWTPPPSPRTCGQPCSYPCSPPPFCPSKCKMMVCRSSPCKPKGCRKPCGPPCRSVPCSSSSRRKPCRPKPCRPCKPCPPSICCPSSLCSPCKPCKPCRPCPPPRRIFKRPCPQSCCRPCGSCPPSPCNGCGSCGSCKPSACKPFRRCRPGPLLPCKPTRPRCKPAMIYCVPCSPCLPCPPPRCRPCPPVPCRDPCRVSCCLPLCGTPCKSSPCLRPCPRRCKRRRCKSQPRIRAHRKRISPCLNRSKCCPVVRCRSVPGPCFRCSPPPCPPICPPRKCCSSSLFKPPKCCKSACSSCCP